MVRVYEVLIALAVIVVITWIGDRFRPLAGIVASMPLTIPLTMAIVYFNTGRSAAATAEFAGGAVRGVVALGAFTVASWLALRRGWTLLPVVVVGYAAWGAVLGLWHLGTRLLGHGG
ncbi:MAG: hypothetical protein ACP5SI_06580 [Chloroflexia bacterium]